MSSACLVPVSSLTKNSLIPVYLPLLKEKNTLLPAPIGLQIIEFSYSVEVLIETLPAVKVVPPESINCVWSVNNNKSSSKEIALLKIETFFAVDATSTGSVSKASVAVSVKN